MRWIAHASLLPDADLRTLEARLLEAAKTHGNEADGAALVCFAAAATGFRGD